MTTKLTPRERLTISALLGALAGWLVALEAGLAHRGEWWVVVAMMGVACGGAVDG